MHTSTPAARTLAFLVACFLGGFTPCALGDETDAQRALEAARAQRKAAPPAEPTTAAPASSPAPAPPAKVDRANEPKTPVAPKPITSIKALFDALPKDVSPSTNAKLWLDSAAEQAVAHAWLLENLRETPITIPCKRVTSHDSGPRSGWMCEGFSSAPHPFTSPNRSPIEVAVILRGATIEEARALMKSEHPEITGYLTEIKWELRDRQSLKSIKLILSPKPREPKKEAPKATEKRGAK